MKYEVVAGWDGFEFESDNQNLQFVVVSYVGGVKQAVKVFEDEGKAERFQKSQVRKFDKYGVAGRVGKYAVFAKEGVK